MPDLAAELVSRRVALIVNPSGAAAPIHAVLKDIPVGSLFGDDPLRSGLVASLNRPGGNRTGVALFSMALRAKGLEVLREAVPKAKTKLFSSIPEILIPRRSATQRI